MTGKAWAARMADKAPSPYDAPPTKPHRAARPKLPPYCLSIEDAAAYLGIDPINMRRKAIKGEIPRIKIGRRTMIRREDLERYCDRQVEDDYLWRMPQTMGQARSAARDAERFANEFRTHAKASKDPETTDFLLLAAKACAQLSLFFRWNAGIGEFAPDAIYDLPQEA